MKDLYLIYVFEDTVFNNHFGLESDENIKEYHEMQKVIKKILQDF